MYWLLDEGDKQSIRDTIAELVTALAPLKGTNQADQIFPYVGRKDAAKASEVIKHLSAPGDRVVDPFSGSGIFSYTALELDREVKSNEWEPYAHRMSTAPWRLPEESSLRDAVAELESRLKPKMDYLYRTICSCGHIHVLDSLFFDLSPLKFVNIEDHERLGPNGETITYRQKFKCPKCGSTDKFFDESDLKHLEEVNAISLPPKYNNLFQTEMIKNSRINISDSWRIYGRFFPHRSKVALVEIWELINSLNVSDQIRLFLEDALLAILPQAKYKDYRSKSQDLHVPNVKLREVNLFYRFQSVVWKRFKRLHAYSFSTDTGRLPIRCADFRDFLSDLEPDSAQLLFTDPPWTDGNAYFEKAQFYHPWLSYQLSRDGERLRNEFVVTDAPTRSNEHNIERWWKDMDEFFQHSARVVKDMGYIALYFRPIPVNKWLSNLNRLKFHARKAGFEPLLSIDVSSKDPSMRIQQSASFVFSGDIVFVFLKLPAALQRRFVGEVDLDHLAFQTADELQEEMAKPFSAREWRREFAQKALKAGAASINSAANESLVGELFNRYLREVEPGRYLLRPDTPFTGQLFDIPAAERLFSYVPAVVEELAQEYGSFTFEMFLLRLGAFVENGTRMLINEVETVDMRRILDPYAVLATGSKEFVLRPAPKLPSGIKQIMDLDPYEFEHFAAELLRRSGFKSVAVQGGAGDRGVDIAAIDPDGIGTVVQCKRYINNVSASPIQRLHSFAVTRGADRRIVMTTSDFTRDAKDEARRTDTELVNGNRLQELVASLMPDYLSPK